jgi:hypothetical protein
MLRFRANPNIIIIINIAIDHATRTGCEICRPWSVKRAMESNTWIGKITINDVLSFDHASQFVELMVKLSHIELEDDVEDDIYWKFTISEVLVYNA